MIIVVTLASMNTAWELLSVVGMVVLPGGWVIFSMVTLVALLLGMWKSNPGGTLPRVSA